jgi:hypothetical protein
LTSGAARLRPERETGGDESFGYGLTSIDLFALTDLFLTSVDLCALLTSVDLCALVISVDLCALVL